MSNHARQSDLATEANLPAQATGRDWPRWVRIASIATIVISLVLVTRLLPIEQLVQMLSSRVDGWGVYGPILFGAVYVVAAVCFVPGSALTLAAGAVFGLWLGTLTVSVASTTAAALSFLIGRYAARDRVRHLAARNRRFQMIDRAIGAGGWKVVGLLRLSPVVPFSAGNYLFGLTPVRFWPYVLTSWIAMLPGTFMFVYLGYAGRVSLGSKSEGRTPAQWSMLAVGLIATLVVTVYVTRLARRLMKEQAGASDQDEPRDNAKEHLSRRGWVSSAVLLTLAILLAGGTACAYRDRSILSRLFGPPSVTLAEAYGEKPDGPTFDHAPFDALVAKYVDDAGLVDYKGLSTEAPTLDRYIGGLATAPVDKFGRNERLAFLLNAYNAFTLRLILDHQPVKSIMDIPADKRWDAKRWNISGQVYSLNQIEHELIRPNFKEPRVHFALVCAAMGCPPLRNQAYTGAHVSDQLDAQAQYVHTHDRWFKLDADKKVVYLTSLYDWYGGDFAQVAGSVVQFAARYSPALKQQLDVGVKSKVVFLTTTGH